MDFLSSPLASDISLIVALTYMNFFFKNFLKSAAAFYTSNQNMEIFISIITIIST